ncbi:JAB domain-containing protein [Chryseotalea sanaruensis]|uniref:JAB domain-containing protein n=1 Tax=Chryseotalea sanaruensis TaxID=2482724 RepID=A0A401UAG1_9BACT|nr:DNA repair protein RadC [Chryseotalea sanaruensis]GCC51879.1 JAB domain-containing protein [Chryseotalea sanaruensis]
MQEIQDKALGIKNWAAEDRPREKLLLKGKASLTDAELIAILLGTGTASLSALDLAKKVLQTTGNNLDELARLNITDLIKTKGIGEAKAITIVAALELGRRRKELSIIEKPRITSSKDAFHQVSADLMDLPHEEFWIILTNRANRIVKKQQISSGGVAGTVADPKMIFKLAVAELASGLILAHNHPSGNLNASQADIALTKKIKEAGVLLEIQLLDHIIVAGKRYFSFADEGML